MKVKPDANLSLPSCVFYLILVSAWVSGAAIAKGFWMTLICFALPPVAWVVLAHAVMERLGVI